MNVKCNTATHQPSQHPHVKFPVVASRARATSAPLTAKNWTDGCHHPPLAHEHITMMCVYCAHTFITHACLPLLSLCVLDPWRISKNTRVTQSEIEPPNTTRSQTPSGEQPQAK
ncbi:uncharacterized protein TM35_000301700 [Trypanosoma theileri]|uniref:Uncharacterized protein n=1 Tax=Trypanosoma theileri TaxID=67003 RepID=A0A1X0NPR8_9TRYP|nr:uncharacterized protein TM35_000301700 [Trypanosoma theileri]ORC86130.1 hypothetical protein TM35_000301700 [Trypanosoma theileri]